jgi:ribonucleoside-diphosphate reductase alpha chain
MGSFVSGMMDAFATVFSIALQYGVPLQKLIDKFKFTRFEPEGMVPGPVRNATSVVDYVVKWLELRYTQDDQEGVVDDD